MLHGRIANVQTSWVKLGTEGTQMMLQGGANDLGGTLMEETISRMAGSAHGSARTADELVSMANGIGRPARQRTTTYAIQGTGDASMTIGEQPERLRSPSATPS
jgi:FO synthase